MTVIDVNVEQDSTVEVSKGKNGLVRTGGAVAALVGVLAILPSVLSPFNLIFAAQILIYATVALSLQLLWGRAGQLSFGQAAFFGIGAYSYAIVGTRYDIGGWLSVGIAVAVPVLMAFVLGYFLFFGKVRDAYFSIVTLAFVLIANQVVISWRSVTGGDTGLTRVPGLVLPFGAFSIDFSTRNGRYYLAATVLLVGLLVLLWVRSSSFGLVLEAIRDDENRAAFLGYNTSWYLTAAFTLSAAIAGLAGGMFASVSTLAAPDMLDQFLSIQILTWVAIGGRNYLAGALVGTVIMRILSDQISSFLTDSWPLVVGLFFIIVVLAFPQGIVGELTRIKNRNVARLGGRRANVSPK